MNARIVNAAAAITLLLGLVLVGAIGVAVAEVHDSITATAATAQINDGAAELAKGPPRVGPAALSQPPTRVASRSTQEGLCAMLRLKLALVGSHVLARVPGL